MMEVVDFHCHLLPKVDDGSKSLEESLEMLRLSGEQGIRLVVATPHFYPRYDTPEHFLAQRDRAAETLRAAMPEGYPQVILGAEVYFFRGISESEMLPKLCIQGTGLLLIEMPPAPWPQEYYRELAAIRDKQGLIPIIAHIDRYIRPLRTYGIPEKLEKLPVLVQANGNFFLESATAGMARRLLKQGRIHLLGSDSHNMTDRKPNLGAAIQKIQKKLGDAGIASIVAHQEIMTH